METVSDVAVKLEPECDSIASQGGSDSKVMFNEEIKIKTEAAELNESVKPEPGYEEQLCAPESIMVKMEPKYYSSGDGHQHPLPQSSTAPYSKPKPSLTFDDLLKIWEKDEEEREFGFFFAYCRATADCGGYDVDTDTDIDSDEELKNIPKLNQNTSKYYIGRNGYKWSKSPMPLLGYHADETPACTMQSENNPYNLWRQLVDDSILDEILKWTNVKLEECRALIKPSNPNLRKLDMIELKAFFGSFMYMVYCNLNIQPVKEVYMEGLLCMPIYESIMSKNRFISILNCLSFGDPKFDIESSDRNVAILFEKFVENCAKTYKGSSYAVIGETVVPFWGDENDEKFPGKYTERPCRDGFRMPCLFDVTNGFLYNLYIPYTELGNRGFTDEERKFCEGTQLALVLTKPIHGKNINVTCNKEYMSFELINAFDKLGLTCIGPIEKTHKEIPPEFLPTKKRQKKTVLYGYSEKVTLMSYVNRSKKATIIASSKPCLVDEKAAKPTLLQLYKRTRYARMSDDDFNFHRRTRLVPVALFYKLFDFSIHNAQILFSLNKNKKIPTHNMVKFIAYELCKEHLKRRAADPSVPASIKAKIVNILKDKKETYEDEDDFSDEEYWSSDSD